MRGRPGRASARPETSKKPAATHGWRTLSCAAAILTAGLLAYASSFQGVFVFDDIPAIVRNPTMRGPLLAAAVAPRDTTLAGRPVASLSFALNHAIAPAEVRDSFTASSGDSRAQDAFLRNAWGYHAVNVAIHLLAALCLFGCVRLTLRAPAAAARFAGNPDAVALAVAAIWVVHPLTTAAVTYVVQRAESLMALFYLLTLYGAIRARQGNPRRWTAIAAAACFLGVGTKEAIATAPIVVVAWDWLFLGLPAREILSQRWRLYALLFASWLPLGWILYTAPRAASVGPGLQGVTPVQYLLTQAGVLLHYLRLVFVPWPLVLDYEWPIAGSIRDVAVPLLVVTALGAATAWGLFRRRAWAMAGVCFFVILAPTSSVVPIWTEVAAEHRMYLPVVGPIALAVAAFAIAAARLRALEVISRPAGRAAAVVAAIVVVAGLGTITYGRAFDYSSEEAAYVDTVQKRPGNSRARNNLATIWLTQNRFDEAETALREAVRLNPNNAEALSNLGVALAVQGREAEGLPFMARAVAIDPDYADGWRNYAEALASLGRLPDAIPAYYKALAARPDDVRLLCSLAWTLATAPQDGARDGRSALDLANRAVRLTGGHDVVALEALAAAAAERGQFSDAVQAEQSAMALAQAAGADQALAALRERLAAYQAGQPIRQRLPR